MLDSQERAFWDVFRPMPNCINTTEVDIKKAYRKGGSSLGSGSSGSTRVHNNLSVDQLTRHVSFIKVKLFAKHELYSREIKGLELSINYVTFSLVIKY